MLNQIKPSKISTAQYTSQPDMIPSFHLLFISVMISGQKVKKLLICPIKKGIDRGIIINEQCKTAELY
jgi:hypothetical protein